MASPVACRLGDLLISVTLLLIFAWVARGWVGARELTWGRTLLAVFIGIAFGQAVAVLIPLRDISQAPDIDGAQLLVLSLPFALIGTMGAIVVLELLFTRPQRRPRRHVPIRSRHSNAGWGSPGAAGR